MKSTGKDRTSTETTMPAHIDVGSWVILVVLVSLLLATGLVIYVGWTLENGAHVPTSGYAALDILLCFFVRGNSA
jgi:hypothetical protein